MSPTQVPGEMGRLDCASVGILFPGTTEERVPRATDGGNEHSQNHVESSCFQQATVHGEHEQSHENELQNRIRAEGCLDSTTPLLLPELENCPAYYNG